MKREGRDAIVLWTALLFLLLVALFVLWCFDTYGAESRILRFSLGRPTAAMVVVERSHPGTWLAWTECERFWVRDRCSEGEHRERGAVVRDYRCTYSVPDTAYLYRFWNVNATTGERRGPLSETAWCTPEVAGDCPDWWAREP